MKNKENIIRGKTYEFSIDIIRLYSDLYKQKEFVLSKQLLRSGTAIGANIEEATAAQSRKDFVSKMSIASKEARETNYWLRLLRDCSICDYFNKSEDIIKIITAIVKTSQKNPSQRDLKF